MKPRSLYIHVPFCTRRCSYCDFAVEATAAVPTEAWLDAVEGEIGLLAAERGWVDPLQLDTIYVGGGTPSLLDPGAMDDLARRLRRFAEWDEARIEWTCEANPESFAAPIADAWRRAGVNRISLGNQTFHEPTLRWMGRMHGSGGAERAMAVARDAGFDNVSLDLIFGVPERLGRVWSDDLHRTLLLEPEHISLYGLTAEAAAPLGRWVREGRETLADDDRYADEYLLAHSVLTGVGMEHYEVSNFAAPGRISRHNSTYWTGAAYAALGPGAHALYPPIRRWNVRGWTQYQSAVAAGRLPVEDIEALEPEDTQLEGWWLGLRTRRGINLGGMSIAELDLAARWVGAGWATSDDDVLRLTPAGWLLLDRLAVEISSADPQRSGKPVAELAIRD